MTTAATPLGQLLARQTREGELYERLPNGRVRCFACGHRCLIPPGRDGVCRVRFNDAGTLRVPFGYVSGLQLDPVEKKPFFHALPGAKALSFGMLGCDYHCSYCFPGETIVVTASGPVALAELHQAARRREQRADAELAYPEDVRVVAASGQLRRVLGVARHHYEGDVVKIQAYYLPPVRCTPDHRVFATRATDQPPALVSARELSLNHYLAVPRRIAVVEQPTLDVARELRLHRFTRRIRWDLPLEGRELVSVQSAAGVSSRAIGVALGKSSSYVRHVRGRIARGLGSNLRNHGIAVEGDSVRFPGEHAPGIPAAIALEPKLGALLGYYCAEGCVVRNRRRPNSYTLNFGFGPSESALAHRVKALLRDCLGVEARLVARPTTLGVSVAKSSAALLFKALAGGRSSTKQVPQIIANAPLDVARAFLEAYVEGNGHRYPNGKVSTTTVSQPLAYGVALLALRLGHLPSIYSNEVGPIGTVEGRRVNRAPIQHSVVWYPERTPRRRLVETPDYYLVPVRSVKREPFGGSVYNLEVEDEHSYLAGFFAVSNCQNWVTSQALRDPAATSSTLAVSPAEIVVAARRAGARIVTSTYNEPLITSEWAVAVFREAKSAGLVCSYVSNGNGTEEVLEYLRPWVSLYKVDLKGFRDRPYRDMGGTLERVTWTIQALHAKSFWVEVVTLVVPGLNDSAEELRDIARFLVSVSPDIPWHVTAFHPDYKMDDRDATSVRTLLRAAETGAAEGLHFVYAGNLPGAVRSWENTNCPACRALLIERVGYRILQNRIGASGQCPDCRRVIPGVWG